LCNDLEAGVSKRFPVIAKIKKELLNQGAIGALMTGSGSTVFGLFADQDTASKATESLSHQPQWQVYATELLC
jgi:4-diphosphocytidyl-2-C-methyl-D-erythritol kinase